MVTTVSPVKTVKQIEMSFGMGTHGRHGDPDLRPEEAFFSARDAMLTRYMMSVLPSVRLLCHKPILYRNDWTNRAVFLAWGFLPPIPYCVVRKSGYLQNHGYFPQGLCPKLRTLISLRQVGRVVNKSRRRRYRRSSLLTTPIRQSWQFTTSRSTVTPDSISAICC